MKKATHQGHCQVCGKVQALPTGELSLHGYKVAGFGFFNGVCQGARHLPLQEERTVTDSIIIALGEFADRMDVAAAAYKAGTRFPSKARSGNYIKVTKTNRRGSWTVSEPEYVDFALAPLDRQQRAVEIAIHECESEARHARSHAVSLTKLAAEIHGTALIAIKTDEPSGRTLKAGDVLSFGGQGADFQLIARTTVRRGYSGDYTTGWTCKNLETGREFKEADGQLTRSINRARQAGREWLKVQP